MHYDGIEALERPAAMTGDETPPPTSSTPEFERFLRYAGDRASATGGSPSLREWLDLAETWRITRALRDCKGNRSAAARNLGIGRRTLYAKMDKLGIVPSWTV